MIKIITSYNNADEFEERINKEIKYFSKNGYKINGVDISHSVGKNSYTTTTVFMCVIDYDEPAVG